MFKRLIDFITLGSPRPMRRLLAYYAALFVVTFLLYKFLPIVDQLLSGEGVVKLTPGAGLLQDGLAAGKSALAAPVGQTRIEHAYATLIVFLSTLALMLPVTWVYMSARRDKAHNQSVVQTLLVLPMIVAGVILIVRDSLALAFSLAGVVAAVRFKTSLGDARDVVFIFLAMAVGFAAGTQVLSVAALLSLIFNFVLVLIWQYDFGRNVLEPTAIATWAEPLNELAGKDRAGSEVPDRDLMLALTPKKVDVLAERFDRVRDLVGEKKKAPRYTAILSLTTSKIAEAQECVEVALNQLSKRWKLDEVITNEGRPSELFYLVKLRKDAPKNDLITAIRKIGGTAIIDLDLEVGEAREQEKLEQKLARKQTEKLANT